MCKGGGVSGQNNEVETVNTKVNSGDIVDKEQGFTLVSLHINTMLGTMEGMLVVLGILTCMISICSGPLRRSWRALWSCCRTEGGKYRRSGGWSGGAGVVNQGNLHQRHNDFHMSLMAPPNVHNIHPDNPGCGHSVGIMNNSGCEGNVRSPIGVETGGGRTPL